jgi:ribosomal protein S6--L-glutamate ligase
MGVVLVNDVRAVATARNKFLTQQVLTAAGLPCPDTVFVNDAAGVFQAVDRLDGYPVVIKPVNARQGTGVLRIENADDARQQALDALDRQHGLMLQRYLPPEKRRDIRALVIGGKLVCAARFVPPAGEFRANFHLGATIRPISLSNELESLALDAASAMGCDVAGVDMMVADDGRPLIVEVNYSPGFKGMEAASGQDIAGRIIAFAAERYHQPGKHRTDK